MALKPLTFFLLLFFVLISVLFMIPCYGDLGTAARLRPPYIPNSCGLMRHSFRVTTCLLAAGEGVWDNGAACGRQYVVSCTSAAAPGTCIPGQTIQVVIVDRALTLASQPSMDGTSMVLSGPAFQTIATPSTASINIDFKMNNVTFYDNGIDDVTFCLPHYRLIEER
ncbi:RlpA-like protein, double-psi beta-barrel domain [Sesbania bispinosa]|nr:RlpA-like protein, double-psi beta-barrel domain [Sesbania bispinosa]